MVKMSPMITPSEESSENQHHRGMRITFIHGIGDGILKAALRKELDEVLGLRCSYNVGDPAVTVVSIK